VAINPQLQIGDLIVATSLAQHDLDITAFGHKKGYVPGGKVFVESSEKLRQLAKKVAKIKGLRLKKAYNFGDHCRA